MYVLMITPNKFPEGDAGAVRDEYFAKIYQKIGYDVVHIGMGVAAKSGRYKEIEFYSLYRKNLSKIEKVRNALSYKKHLEKTFMLIKSKLGSPALIHIYDLPKSGFEWAKQQAIENKIPIIHDSVEWYSPCEFKWGCLAYPYLMKERTNRKLVDNPIAVIAISSYLESYFKQKGLKTIRIPVIMDSRDYIPKERKIGDPIKLVYAGSPAKKDYLKECIIAFNRLKPEIKSKFEFAILGADAEYVKKYCNGDIPREIIAYGRVPRKTVISKLEESDFALLLRPANERYTQAGFPTKSVEAMMNGCAMVCNLTSDLDMYLKNEENSIIVEDSTSDAMYKAFLKISELSNFDLISYRNKARSTAENNFDYCLYIGVLKEFINNINSKKEAK